MNFAEFLQTEFRTIKREIHWREIWEEIRRKRQRERDRGAKDGGEREERKETDKRKGTSGTGHRERDTGKPTEDQM